MRLSSGSLGLCFAALALAQAPETASVSGAVTQSITGAPITRARVTLRSQGRTNKIYAAVTTDDGKFSIAGVAPGEYQASAERIGFFAPVGRDGRSVVDVTVRPGLTREELKLRLAPLGSIAGRVLDAEGEPVEMAAVSIETGPITSGIRDTTDDKGRFRLVGLQPGRYRVRAAISRSIPVSLRPEIRTDGTTEIRYAPTYFGGGTEFKSATRIEVATGADVNGIEIRLARAPMTRITGKVVGFPPESRLSLRYTQIYGARPGTGEVRKDGTFELWNVDPGKYFFAGLWISEKQPGQTSPINLEVGQSNIDNVELRAIPPSDLAGQIVFDDEQARPPSQGAAKPRLEVRTVDPANAGPVISDVAADGSFHLAGVPAARYRVMLSWTSAFVKSVALGPSQAEGNVLNLRNGGAGTAMTVVLSSAFGSISGRVLDGDTPVPNARIALVRDDFVSLGDVTFITSDAAGSYTLSNVRPGKYRIAAIEDLDEAPRSGNLDDYEDVLSAIDLQPRGTVKKDLKRHAPVK